MIRQLVLLVLLGCITRLCAQNTTVNSSQAKVATGTFHVVRCTSTYFENGYYRQYVDGLLDGKKIQLQSDPVVKKGLVTGDPQTLPPGDYPLQLVEEKQEEWGISRRYLLTMPSGKQMKYKLVGLSE